MVVYQVISLDWYLLNSAFTTLTTLRCVPYDSVSLSSMSSFTDGESSRRPCLPPSTNWSYLHHDGHPRLGYSTRRTTLDPGPSLDLNRPSSTSVTVSSVERSKKEGGWWFEVGYSGQFGWVGLRPTFPRTWGVYGPQPEKTCLVSSPVLYPVSRLTFYRVGTTSHEQPRRKKFWAKMILLYLYKKIQ